MKKKFFSFFIFIACFLAISCSDKYERIVTVKLRGGNEFGSVSKIQVIRSFDGEEVELTEIIAQNKEGIYTEKAMSVLDGSKLEFRVFPGDKHIFEEFSGDLKNNNTVATLEVDGDKNIEVFFYFDTDIFNEPPISGGEYLVDHSSHLRWIADKITNDIDGKVKDNFNNKVIKLVDNISMENMQFDGIASTEASENASFAGTLDGNGFSINNLNINTGKTVAGLVGNLAGTGSIKNLSLRGTMSLSEANYAGSFVGKGAVGAKIENVYSEVNIDLISLMATSSIGGIAGADVEIKNAYNAGSILLNSSLQCVAAGIIGKGGKLENVYNTGQITGAKDSLIAGIAGNGSSSSTISFAYNVGSLSVIDETDIAKKGGIAIGNYTVASAYFLRIDGAFNDGIIAIANDPAYPDTVAYTVDLFKSPVFFSGFDPAIWVVKNDLKAGSGSRNILVSSRPVIIGLGEGK